MAITQVAAVLLGLFAFLGACIAEEYTVGDRAGWQPGNVDYTQWAARHAYRAGDSLLFAYEKGSQSVMRVSQEDYHACRTSRPIEHHISGNTLVHLRRDDYYFISGVQGHCNAGMKLAVILAGGSPSAAPSTPVTVTPTSSPPTVTPVSPPTVPPALPPPAVTPVSPPTPAPVAPPTAAPASTPIASPPPAPVSPPTAAPVPTSVPTPGALPPSPPAPPALSPESSPLAAPPPPNAASALQSTLGAMLITALGIFYLLA